jgi:hypothetical protein
MIEGEVSAGALGRRRRPPCARVGVTTAYADHAACDACDGRPRPRPSDSKFQFEQLGLPNSTAKI